MKRYVPLALLWLAAPVSAQAAELPKPIATGLTLPESVAAAGGKVYASVIGERDKDGDGAVVVIENGKATPFVTGLDDPKGVAAYQRWLFVADKTKVWRIDFTAKAPKG